VGETCGAGRKKTGAGPKTRERGNFRKRNAAEKKNNIGEGGTGPRKKKVVAGDEAGVIEKNSLPGI